MEQYQTVVDLMTSLHGSQYEDFGSHIVKLTAILETKQLLMLQMTKHLAIIHGYVRHCQSLHKNVSQRLSEKIM